LIIRAVCSPIFFDGWRLVCCAAVFSAGLCAYPRRVETCAFPRTTASDLPWLVFPYTLPSKSCVLCGIWTFRLRRLHLDCCGILQPSLHCLRPYTDVHAVGMEIGIPSSAFGAAFLLQAPYEGQQLVTAGRLECHRLVETVCFPGRLSLVHLSSDESLVAVIGSTGCPYIDGSWYSPG
jgi:hypothetical protein